jgi:hypothetical protein
MRRPSESRVPRWLHLPLIALLSLGAVPTTACKKKAPEVAAVAYAVGDKVDVNWNGAWWKGEVLALKGEKFRVHYTGWSANWDEDVPATRLRAPTDTAKEGTEAKAVAAPTPTEPAPDPAPSAEPVASATAAPVAAKGRWKAGDRVDINWHGGWHQGRVLSVTGALYRVHYLGWGANWDESVPASRLRPPTSTAKRGSNPKD